MEKEEKYKDKYDNQIKIHFVIQNFIINKYTFPPQFTKQYYKYNI